MHQAHRFAETKEHALLEAAYTTGNTTLEDSARGNPIFEIRAKNNQNRHKLESSIAPLRT